MNEDRNQKFIVRCKSGVFYASVESRTGDEAVLTDARRIHYWSGATECIGIAQNGIGNGSRVTVAAPSITVIGVVELIPVSANAEKILSGYPVWTA